MNKLFYFFTKKSHIAYQAVLLLLAFLYYLFFVNRGLVLFDEGYFVHLAERIYQGEKPYQDFALQYGPAYFYFLALFYKIFGVSILTGRFLNLFICLGILVTVFLMLNQLRITSLRIITFSFLSIIAFGFPLIHIPNIVWANVLVGLVSFSLYLRLLKSKTNAYFLLFLLGLLLALGTSLKQNIGVAFLLFFITLVFFYQPFRFLLNLKRVIFLFAAWITCTLMWVYYFFLSVNTDALSVFLTFSQRFASEIAFTYPSFAIITHPLGIFKLLPYYLPFFFGLFLFYRIFFSKQKNIPIIVFGFLAILGFTVTIFPQTDLLHIYPFYGIVLVALLIFSFPHKIFPLVFLLIVTQIVSGFYLTFFTKNYRYEKLFIEENVPLPFPRTRGILKDKKNADDIIALSRFLNVHTVKDEYILVYPYSPMLYFVLERKNPSKDAIYYQNHWHFYSDRYIISEIEEKKVRYIVTEGPYIFDSDLSRFIQKQKKVYETGSIIVFSLSYDSKK